ncbi:MAG: copper resistance protein B [Xanthomonadales bacterium]|nr:copper resistance protein B [Xanthomonadales bacterium]
MSWQKLSIKFHLLTLIWVVLLGINTITWAAEDKPMSEMDHSKMQMGDENPDAEEVDHSQMPMGDESSGDEEMDHSQMQMGDENPEMQEMSQGSMQGGPAPDNARDPHAYSGGYTIGTKDQRLVLADEYNFNLFLVDRLEVANGSGNTSVNYGLQAWFGRDYNRLVLKAEGSVASGSLEEASTELLWGRALSTFWDTQLGIRYDNGEGPDRSWLAFGIQGLAPYWFEVDITGYIGQQGRTALSMEAEYEILLTQKLILQPRIEVGLYGKDDLRLGIGSGLSEASAGLRLRYEFRREFAPYIGLEWTGKFGKTADLARAAGQDTKDTRVVAGLRFWF